MERGRDKFNKYKKIMLSLSKFIGCFPLSFRKKIYLKIRNTSGNVGLAFRYIVLKTLVKELGDNVSVHPNVFIFHPENLSIGNNVSIHPMCYIDATGEIEIGDDVSVAHGSTILSSNHIYKDIDIPIKDQGMENRRTIICNNVWLGAKSTILGGVVIQSGNVVAAGAVVTKNFEKNSVLAGVPAKIIQRR